MDWKLEVVVVPTHRPMIRKDMADLVYLNQSDKFDAIIEDIRDCVKRGQPVRGGHSHHVRVINTIRRCGGIAAAVEQGVVRGGIFYECVKKGVPFALAGSIRDDGPLLETEMDLIKAQAEYAQLIRGAEMILMLSTMLHSIGVGNMTPAGVKLVCVDINPAVVTKLADRGSIESAGIVTDVGLFLSLLRRQLEQQRGALPTPRR